MLDSTVLFFSRNIIITIMVLTATKPKKMRTSTRNNLGLMHHVPSLICSPIFGMPCCGVCKDRMVLLTIKQQ